MLMPKLARFHLKFQMVLLAFAFFEEPALHAQATINEPIPHSKPTGIVLAARSRKSKSTSVAAEKSSNGARRGTPKAEVGGYFSYASVNLETSTEEGADSEKGSIITISTNYLMILQQQYAIGPTLTYSSSSQGDSGSSSYGLGGTGKYYFADFAEKMVPFASFTLQISGRSQTYSETDPTTGESTTETSSGSGFGFVFGGGLHYLLLRRSVAVTPELQYYSNSTDASGVTFKESGVRLLAGFVIFL
jgi:hypothetical protein